MLEIPMFDGQVNVEVLNSWLKQLEVYFGLYQIREEYKIYFSHLKMIGHMTSVRFIISLLVFYPNYR